MIDNIKRGVYKTTNEQAWNRSNWRQQLCKGPANQQMMKMGNISKIKY